MAASAAAIATGGAVTAERTGVLRGAHPRAAHAKAHRAAVLPPRRSRRATPPPARTATSRPSPPPARTAGPQRAVRSGGPVTTTRKEFGFETHPQGGTPPRTPAARAATAPPRRPRTTKTGANPSSEFGFESAP